MKFTGLCLSQSLLISTSWGHAAPLFGRFPVWHIMGSLLLGQYQNPWNTRISSFWSGSCLPGLLQSCLVPLPPNIPSQALGTEAFLLFLNTQHSFLFRAFTLMPSAWNTLPLPSSVIPADVPLADVPLADVHPSSGPAETAHLSLSRASEAPQQTIFLLHRGRYCITQREVKWFSQIQCQK